MTNLIVIVDPDYAQSAEIPTEDGPVWIVATQTNQHACERLWKDHPPPHRQKGAVTCYQAPNSEDRLGSLLYIIPALEDHHGEIREGASVFPLGFVLEVIGLALNDNVATTLREYGFTSFVETPEGFRACQ